MDTVSDWIGGGGRRNTLHAFGEHLIAVAEVNLQSERVFLCVKMGCIQALNEALNLHAGVRSQHVFRLGENILNKRRRHDAERDFTVNTAEGQVVNLIPERWDVRPLTGVNIHDEYVLSV